MALAYSMDKIGPMARSTEDCARIFAAIAGHDSLDRDTLGIDKAAFTYSPAAELRGRALKLGWLTNAWTKIDPGVERAVHATHKVLERRFPGMKDAVLPQGPWEDAASLILKSEIASAFAPLIQSGRVRELADPLGRISGYISETVSGADYTTAQRIREILQMKMSALFDSFDVLVAASQPVAATPLDLNLFTDLSFPDPLGGIGNLCGLPALSVPCGFTEKSLPVGIQFVARAGDDAAVLEAGRTFQQATDWHRKHPKIVEA
jgi:aspartyl-tRNA(Asn)/glutamyl-tRNA(Gln) amidotransferase subunit A